MKFVLVAAALGVAVALAAPAQAGEAYGGVYVHAANTPFTLDSEEGGLDFQAGYRLDPVLPVARIEPYVFASVNSDGDTNFAGVGISRKFPLGPIYLRPGIGLVIHDAPRLRVSPTSQFRTDLGSRVLFEPEIAVGMAVAPRISLEASWVHISNARLFDSGQNPGIDAIGLRANIKL